MNIPKPHILSIHPTMACDYFCHGCYLKRDEDKDREERHPLFFMKLIEVAQKIGIKEIAIPANYIDYKKKNFEYIDPNLFYYQVLKEHTKNMGLEFTCTANYDFITNYIDTIPRLLNDVSLMSISINDFSTQTDTKKQEALNVLKKLKEQIPNVNCNILVSPHMIKLLKEGLLDEILEIADTIYLLVQKPLIMSMDKIKEWLSGLDNFLDLIDGRLLLDSCLKNEFGLTDGICSRHQMIYVNPYGDVKMCSYDAKTLVSLNDPEELATLFNSEYPQQQIFNCPLLQHN